MLDIETKRRIDTARDILVGKVPDPKSQVEQMNLEESQAFLPAIMNATHGIRYLTPASVVMKCFCFTVRP